MKKILSTTLALLLVLTTVFSVSLSAQAAVRYDSDNAALYSGRDYTWLNIRGTENYKSAFQFMDILNTERTANAPALWLWIRSYWKPLCCTHERSAYIPVPIARMVKMRSICLTAQTIRGFICCRSVQHPAMRS